MILVDGHNLAFADDDARAKLQSRDPEAAIRRVIELVDAYARSVRQRATVIFDGTGGIRQAHAALSLPKGGGEPAGAATTRVKYAFAGAEHTADSEVLRVLRGSTGRREITLVTSDRTLAVAARKSGARIIDCGTFLEAVAAALRKRRKAPAPEPVAKRLGPSPDEVAFWLTVFSDQDVADAEKENPPAPRKRKR